MSEKRKDHKGENPADRREPEKRPDLSIPLYGYPGKAPDGLFL